MKKDKEGSEVTPQNVCHVTLYIGQPFAINWGLNFAAARVQEKRRVIR